MKDMLVEDLLVLYEDNHVIVVLKPQNVPCCEDESKDKDLLTIVKEHIKIKENKPGNVYAGLVHRLDRVTGGVMVYVCPQTVEGAKFCELEYQVMQKAQGMALTKVILHTGRTHQIRVQSAAIGCPVYGDMRYGGEKAKKGFLALWATSLAFTHPVSKERLVFKIEPPKDNTPWNLFDVSKEIELF